MAKKPFTIEEPPHEKHYSRKISESTPKGIDEIIALSKSTSKKIHRKLKEFGFMLEGSYYKRREAAIRHTLDSVMHRYTFTERTNGAFPTSELWVNLNLLNGIPLEDAEAQTPVILAAALWILDHVSDRIKLQQLLSEAPCNYDSNLPVFCDMAHDSDSVEAVVEILMHRYAGEHFILDVTEDAGDTFDLFHQLIDLLNPKELQKIVAETRALLWASADEFFKIEYPFADHVINLINEYNATVDRINENSQRLSKAILESKMTSKQVLDILKNLPEDSPKPSKIASSTKAGGFAGPFAVPPKAPFAAPFASPKQAAQLSSSMPFSSSTPQSASQGVSFLINLLENGERASDLVRDLLDTEHELSEKLDNLDEEIKEMDIDMVRLGFDYATGGFTYKERYAARYTRIKLQIPSYTFSDPYKICFGILLLCSPTVIRKLFDGVKIAYFNADYDLSRGADFTARQKIKRVGETKQTTEEQAFDSQLMAYLLENRISPNCGEFSAVLVQRNAYASSYFGTIDSYLDLPWLSGLMSGFTADVASHLPWGMQAYDEDSLELSFSPKPMKHTDLYSMKYTSEGYQRSLAQILYETTGVILPRKLDTFDDAQKILHGYGIKGTKAVHIAELMSIMHEVRFRTKMPSSDWLDLFDDEDVEDGNENTGTEGENVSQKSDADSISELKEANAALHDQLKKLTDIAHEQDRRAQKAEQELQQEKQQAKADRQELAALREVIFTQENTSESDESVSIPLPFTAKQRIVIYGGHDTWLKAMKEYLHGDVRYMDKDQGILDRNVIRNADAVWLQCNALAHRQYYAIIHEIRKIGVPVRYFMYASARKCVEQIAMDEKE